MFPDKPHHNFPDFPDFPDILIQIIPDTTKNYVEFTIKAKIYHPDFPDFPDISRFFNPDSPDFRIIQNFLTETNIPNIPNIQKQNELLQTQIQRRPFWVTM